MKDVAIFSPGRPITIRFLSNCIINNNYEDVIADSSSQCYFLNLEKSIIISQYKRSNLLTLLEYFSSILRILVDLNRSTKVVLWFTFCTRLRHIWRLKQMVFCFVFCFVFVLFFATIWIIKRRGVSLMVIIMNILSISSWNEPALPSCMGFEAFR